MIIVAAYGIVGQTSDICLTALPPHGDELPSLYHHLLVVHHIHAFFQSSNILAAVYRAAEHLTAIYCRHAYVDGCTGSDGQYAILRLHIDTSFSRCFHSVDTCRGIVHISGGIGALGKIGYGAGLNSREW